MRTAVCLIALFVLFAAMNLYWQLPVVPLPLIHEPTPLITASILLQPWLFLIGPLLTWTPEWFGVALFRVSVHGASVPLTLLFAAISTAAYYLTYRVTRHVGILRRVGSRPAIVALVVLYTILLSAYGASCGYVTYTLTQRLKALG